MATKTSIKLSSTKVGPTKLEGAASYARTLANYYSELQAKKEVHPNKGGLEEVKLRLFLSLLDPEPAVRMKRAANG